MKKKQKGVAKKFKEMDFRTTEKAACALMMMMMKIKRKQKEKKRRH